MKGRRSEWLSTYLLRVCAALLLLYGGVVAYFAIEEDHFIYLPVREPYQAPDPALGLSPKRLTLRTSDGVSIAALAMHPPASIPSEAAPWLLYCHGNTGNLSTRGYHKAWSKLRALGMGILALDYRGYGASSGVPSEQGLYRDAGAAYAYLQGKLRVPARRIVFYGFSLGSAVAVDLASRLPGAALIVEGSILSVPHRAQEIYPFLPVFTIARNRFASIDKIGRVRMPKLFIHARDDEVNPFSHSQRLYRLSQQPKELLAVTGKHGSAYATDPRFMRGIARFLARQGLLLPATGDANPARETPGH